jgi:hypothetical protein
MISDASFRINIGIDGHLGIECIFVFDSFNKKNLSSWFAGIFLKSGTLEICNISYIECRVSIFSQN